MSDPWVQIYGAGALITVNSSGNALVINGEDNSIYELDGSAFAPISDEATATDIGAGGGKVWIIGTEGSPETGYGIHRLDDSDWTLVPGAANEITVDNNGNAWVVNAANSIYHFNGAAFMPVNGVAKHIGVGGSEQSRIFVVGTDDHVYEFWPDRGAENPWAPAPDPSPETPVEAIAVDDEGRVRIVCGPNKNIYRSQ